MQFGMIFPTETEIETSRNVLRDPSDTSSTTNLWDWENASAFSIDAMHATFRIRIVEVSNARSEKGLRVLAWEQK